MIDHFAERAALIASLADDDPERVAALRHSEECSDCRRALADGVALMRLLDVARETAELPNEAIERASRAIEADLQSHARRCIFLPGLGVVLAFVVEVSIARHVDSNPRAVGVAFLIAAAAVVLACMNRVGTRAVLVALATSAAFALAAASTHLLAPAIGVKCTLLELVAASLPWLAYRFAAGPSRARPASAAVASAGALAGHAALHLTCPVPHADAHLLVFHFGGVVLAALLGAIATPTAPAIRRDA